MYNIFLLLTHKNSRPRMRPISLTTCDFNNLTYVPRWLSMILGMLYVKPQLVATEVQLGMRMIVQSKRAALYHSTVYNIRSTKEVKGLKHTDNFSMYNQGHFR